MFNKIFGPMNPFLMTLHKMLIYLSAKILLPYSHYLSDSGRVVGNPSLAGLSKVSP